MKELIGVFRYEYGMSIRRRSLWIVFAILLVLYLTGLFLPPDMAGQIPADPEILQFAATSAFMFNVFLPVVGGILAADRLVRDRKLGVDELLRSTALKRWAYLAGKYLGTLFSVSTPVLVGLLLWGIISVAKGASLLLLPALLLTFLSINLPTYAFITAFSLLCPLVMPVRVYQVLFTGYWFWGNFLSPEVMPTLNGTYLTASGMYAVYGFFGGVFGIGGPNYISALSRLDAVINLAALAACAGLALFAADRYLALRASRA